MQISGYQRQFLLALAFSASVSLAQQPGELAKVKELELEEVREQISELKKSMDRRAAERDRVTADLQSAEVGIAEKRTKLREIERERDRSEARKAALEADIADRETKLAEESAQLAAQVRAAYMSGRLFTLPRARMEAASEAAKLGLLAEERAAELAELDEAQNRRRELLASLNSKLAAEGTAVERLAAQERDLARLIAELTSILSDYPITSEDPFSELKGRLTWPVAGNVIHNYGEPRAAGQLNWNGVVVAAPRGREVRSVYHGRVVFADWLAGMGLLVIVDHGEGYMTLYGYNETLLKSAGDWVAPGDVIATVGDSGGQPVAGLYFEIRQGTRPVNPRSCDFWSTGSFVCSRSRDCPGPSSPE